MARIVFGSLMVALVLLASMDALAFGRRPRSHDIPASAVVPTPVVNQLQGDDVPAAPVPEPATLLLLGSGAAGVYAWRRKQRNK